MNRYAYVSGNPISSSDPSGTEGVDLKRGEIISKEQFQSAADGDLSISAQDIALRLPGDRGEHLVVPKNAVRYDRSVEGDENHIGVTLESSRWEKRYAIATLELQHRRQTEIGALHILGSKKVIQATAIIGVSGGVSFGLASAGAVVGAGGLALDVVLASAEGAALAEVDGTAAGEAALSSGLSGLGAAGLGKLFGKALGPLVEAAANKADDVLRGVSRSAKDGVEEGLGGVPSIVDDLAPTSQRTASVVAGKGLGLRAPAGRNSLGSVKQGTVAKKVNTVVEPGVDVAGDVAAINQGLAKRVDETFEINGRTYGVHDGTLFPMSGPGLHQLNRGSFQALGVLNKVGDTSQAHAILGKMKNVGPDEVTSALRAWRAGQ